MTLGEAIHTAINYEKKIRDIYRQSGKEASDPVGKRLFQSLADDEQYHVDYLLKKLDQWQETGKVTVDSLTPAFRTDEIPSPEAGRLMKRMSEEDRGNEKQMLSKALSVEVETSSFYEKIIGELPEDGQALFARFLDIEKGHIATVQAQLDYLSSTGYWFDWKEFDME